MAEKSASSSGHQLGQFIGDWWERYVLLPLFQSAAHKLDLFCDNRYIQRSCRGAKIEWEDAEQNVVDFDFVFEHAGSDLKKGVPVAFIESFWRRGGRHSKDKARDDTNKLLPMRTAYPSVRFLSIAACGEFTGPAQMYVKTQNVDLFFIGKSHIVDAFCNHGINIHYPDKSSEHEKAKITAQVTENMTKVVPEQIAKTLIEKVGKHTFSAYKDKIVGELSSTPQLIRISECSTSNAVEFTVLLDAIKFLDAPQFTYHETKKTYKCEIVYSNGSMNEFEGDMNELEAIIRDVYKYDDHIRRQLQK